MAGERKKKQRIRHEAGGSANVTKSTESKMASNERSESQVQSTGASNAEASATGPAAAATAAATAATAAAKTSQAYGGATSEGRGGKAAKRRGVAFATMDESQYYQPVTIMSSKGSNSQAPDGAEELDDTPKQYRRRCIVSNWSRYEEEPPELRDLEDGGDYLIGEDFSDVLRNASLLSGSAGHLRLRDEKGWGTAMEGGTGGQGLGALRVGDLATSLATLPLTTQLNMADTCLPEQLVQFYQQLAADNSRLYRYDDGDLAPLDPVEVKEQRVKEQRPHPTVSFAGRAGTLQVIDNDEIIRNKENNRAVGRGSFNDSLSIAKTEVNDNVLEKSSDPFDSLDFTLVDTLSTEDTSTDSSAVKVDLTAKMCQAFRSFGTGERVGNDDEEIEIHDPADILKFTSQPELSNNDVNKNENNKSIKFNYAPNEKTNKEDKSNSSLDFSSSVTSFNFGLFTAATESASPLTSSGQVSAENIDDNDPLVPIEETKKKDLIKIISESPVIDLNAPILPVPVSLVNTKEDTKELEDWLDSVLDD